MTVPTDDCEIKLKPRSETEFLADAAESLAEAAHALDDFAKRHKAAEAYVGATGPFVLTVRLQPPPDAMEPKVAVHREAVRRVLLHVQAINPAGLDPESRAICGALYREIHGLAARAGVK